MFKNLFTAALMAAASISPALAQSPAQSGDSERGRVLAYTCKGCHAIPFYKNVYPTYSVPRIGGQTESYIVAALKAYRTGQRGHSTMQAQAATLSDQDIADIAAYISQAGEASQ